MYRNYHSRKSIHAANSRERRGGGGRERKKERERERERGREGGGREKRAWDGVEPLNLHVYADILGIAESVLISVVGLYTILSSWDHSQCLD